MKLRLWGVRGSIATPLSGEQVIEKIRATLSLAQAKDLANEASIEHFIGTLPASIKASYGGNTTCVELRSKNNDIIIIDAGTGIRALGRKLLEEDFQEGKGECHILFTHTHWDHIQGFPFFEPLYIAGNKIHIHGIHSKIENRLRYQHNPKFFPVNFDMIPATKRFYQHKEQEMWNLADISITQKALKHPGISYSYRFEENGKVIIFSSDAEFTISNKSVDSFYPYIKFFKDADILIFDTQYTFEDQIQKIDWGHSSAMVGVDIALEANVKHLILFHHDPSYDDEKLDQVLLRTIEYMNLYSFRKARKETMKISIAYEGMEFNF